MPRSTTSGLLQHPAFADVGVAWRQRLEEGVELLRFRPGQPLSDARQIPNRVLVVAEGTARLLGREENRLRSFIRLEAGTVVGLASLLRAAGCEQVTASDDLLAWSLSEQLVLDLHREEPTFRAWCSRTLWPAEALALVELLLTRCRPSASVDLFTATRQALDAARLVEAGATSLSQAEAAGEQVWLASANAEGMALGDPLLLEGEAPRLPRPRGPLPLRLVALPGALVRGWAGGPAVTEAEEVEAGGPTGVLALRDARDAGDAVLASAADVGQWDPVRGLQVVRGTGVLEEILACFQMLSRMLSLPFRRDSVEKVVRDALRRGQAPNIQLCGQLAAMAGLHAVGATVPAERGTRLQTPAIIPWKGGFAVVVASNAAGLRLASPSQGWLLLRPEELEEAFPEGISLVVVDRTAATPEQKFGPNWFWPAIKRYRGLLIQVLVASLVVQLFSLANPLLIQVIIDKVITQRSLDTLQVLGVALVVVTLLEGLITSLRTFLFADTTNRIDMRLGAEVIDHLLRLPLGYFDKRPVGELGTRIAELEKIRSFLTGQALTTIIDGAFTVVYIAVMLMYSFLLSAVALAVIPIQVALTILGSPLFRRQLRQAAQDNARTQSHLVEVLTGIQTVKAQNAEMVSRWKWQEFYSRYIDSTFEKIVTGTALSQTAQVMQKISQLLVLWVGASLVLKGELTLGQLIAFRIISGYVTQPLLRLSTIWQSIQELKVSFERLADVVDTPEESDSTDQQQIPLPSVEGRVRFDSVVFSFRSDTPPVLRGVDLEIEPGTFVGIVGQSGSGKSTLMKLLPRLYAPNSGRVLMDGYDISKVELYSLRRQIGIVPQDPLLFAGSVSENIALTQPDASSEAIVEAARVACAHDFIMELPFGYATNVGERGANLSGGQRQRVAIARTLLANPRMLVMDEATSALDYDTERRVCDNLHQNLKGCTVFFITHRLSTIRRADKIVMMHQGVIVETGTHEELMALRGRYYALYRQQEAS